MHKKYFAFGLMILALVLTGCAEKTEVKGPSNEADIAALRAVALNDYVRAYNTRNFEMLAKLFTQDAVWMAPDKPAIEGKQSIIEDFQRTFEQFSIAVITQTAEDVAVSGDWAHIRGNYEWRASPVSGATPVDVKGKWLCVYKRDADGWKIARSIWNNDAPVSAP